MYLGFVLVGATPVLGHAATTRNFELTDEIEFKDDLDKKPEPTSKELDKAIEDYFNRVGAFLRNLRKLRSIDEFDTAYHTFHNENVAFSPCPATGTGRSEQTATHIDRWLVPTIEEANFIAEEFAWLSDCLPYTGFKTRTEAQSAGIKLSYNKSELLHDLSLNFGSKSRAESVHTGLTAALGRFRSDEEDANYELIRTLLKHTSTTISSDKITVVTQLPRAALDSLLAKDAK